jgi:hypothetical protein
MYLDVSPYKEILAGMEAALGINEGIIKLTGAHGTGKTALGYQLSAILQQRSRQVVFFLHGPRNPDDLQTGILRQLHLREQGNFTRRLTEYLLGLTAENRQLHVLIDNAQQMDEPTLNAVRMLCNIQDGPRALVHVVLLGSPALNDRLAQPGLRSFTQHLSHSFQLQPMQDEQVKDFCWAYWREKLVERAPPDDRWVGEMLKISGGLPGAVLAELGDEEHRNEINISARLEQVVTAERQAQPSATAAPQARSASVLATPIILLLLAGAGFAGYRFLQRPAEVVTTQPVTPVTAVTPAVPPPAAPPAVATAAAETATRESTTVEPTTTELAATVAIPTIVEEPTLPPEITASIVADAEVVRLLNGWVQNWQAQNLPGYFSSYGSAFVPESFPSRAAWESERSRIISAASDVDIGWRELQIRSRNEQNIVAEVWLDYASSTYSDRTLKELTLAFERGRAVIVRERNLTVQP